MSIAAAVRTISLGKPFGLFYAGYVVSAVTDGLAPIVSTIAVLRVSSSPWALSYVLLSLWLGRVVVIPISGRLAAERNPVSVMIASHVVRIIAQAALLATVVSIGNSVLAMTLSALMYGMGAGIYLPAQRVALPVLCGDDALEKANAALSAASNTSLVAGPALGVVAMKLIGYEWILALDCLTFIVNIVALLLLNRLCRSQCIDLAQRRNGDDKATRNSEGTIRSAYRTAIDDRYLGVSLLFWTLASIVIGAVAVFAPSYIIRTTGDVGAWATISTIMAVSSLAGSIAAAVVDRLSYRVALIASALFMAAQIMMTLENFASSRSLIWVLYAVFSIGALLTCWAGIKWITLVQRRLEHEKLAKFMAVETGVTQVGVPLGMVLGPMLVFGFGQSLVGGICLLLVLLAIVVALISPEMEQYAET